MKKLINSIFTLVFVTLISITLTGQSAEGTQNNGRKGSAKAIKKEAAPELKTIVNTRENAAATDDRDIPGLKEYQKEKSDWVLPLDLDLLRDELLNSINGEAYIKKVEELGEAVNELARINQQLRLDNLNIMQSIQNCCAASEGLSNDGNAFLLQNTPNPVNQETEINYYIPSEFATAEIKIFNISGKILKSISIAQNGFQKVNLQNDFLTPGSYVYSLVVDKKMVDSKVMLVINK